MIPSALQIQFDKVLKAERLFDVPAVFGHPEFFDEVPLYSRYKQVEFLSGCGDVDKLLIDLALAYLDRVAVGRFGAGRRVDRGLGGALR